MKKRGSSSNGCFCLKLGIKSHFESAAVYLFTARKKRERETEREKRKAAAVPVALGQ